MHALYVTSVFLHVLAAITWIGGMFFLVQSTRTGGAGVGEPDR